MDKDDIKTLIEYKEKEMRKLEQLEDSYKFTSNDRFKLAMNYFALGDLESNLAFAIHKENDKSTHKKAFLHEKNAHVWYGDAQVELTRLRQEQRNNPLYIQETIKMLEAIGEEVSPSLYKELDKIEKEGYNLKPANLDDTKNVVTIMETSDRIGDSVGLTKINSRLETRLSINKKKEFLSKLPKMIVESCGDDYEFSCGVEGEYLRDMAKKTGENFTELVNKYKDGEIKLPTNVIETDVFENSILYDSELIEKREKLAKKQHYLTNTLNQLDKSNFEEKENLELLLNETRGSLDVINTIMENPQLALDLGQAELASINQNIGSSVVRKQDYLRQKIVKHFSDMIPQGVLGESDKWEYLADNISGLKEIDSHFEVAQELVYKCGSSTAQKYIGANIGGEVSSYSQNPLIAGIQKFADKTMGVTEKVKNHAEIQKNNQIIKKNIEHVEKFI